MIQPVGSRIWLKQLGEAQLANITESGIWLPDQTIDQQQDQMGEIVAIGPKVQQQVLLAPGQRVVTRHLSGTAVEPGPAIRKSLGLGESEPLWYVREGDILAVLAVQ